ncbi:Pr6Pr family membrane protein [Pleomorphovibrio marinus]|uniref:Pr6Pr family membrane protein n=1 Tax=Pleomorphovibrio marinus TaxID=2164132 RepID=UPI000E0BB4DF|nr:Pr6Pr family membrane protein [Pleomorphovibrio marinus]
MALKEKSGLLIGILAGVAVVVQFVLMWQNRQTEIPEMLIRFFSFFTILTNTLVAVYFIGKNRSTFKEGSSSLTAITVYILVVGLVYQIALRPIWDPQGLQKIVDELLHSVMPLMVGLYWWKYTGFIPTPWRNIPKWLIYPFSYLIYVLIRGRYSGFYPYPFLEVSDLGWQGVLINITFIVILFLFLSSLLVGLGNYKNKPKLHAQNEL